MATKSPFDVGTRLEKTGAADEMSCQGGATVGHAQDDRAARARRLEQVIRDFYAACNAGDLDALAALFTPDAVHYFPAGMYGSSEPYRGGRTIAELWARLVTSFGSRVYLDAVFSDPDQHQAATEWTVERVGTGAVIRGSEIYRFDPSTGLIAEVRLYIAAPPMPDVQRAELGGFPYAERGYAASS